MKRILINTTGKVEDEAEVETDTVGIEGVVGAGTGTTQPTLKKETGQMLIKRNSGLIELVRDLTPTVIIIHSITDMQMETLNTLVQHAIF